LLNLLYGLGNLIFSNKEYQGIANDMDAISGLEGNNLNEGTTEDLKIIENLKKYFISLIRFK